MTFISLHYIQWRYFVYFVENEYSDENEYNDRDDSDENEYNNRDDSDENISLFRKATA